MLFLLFPLAFAADGLSPTCAAASASARTAWRAAALPSITKVANCGADVTGPACAAAVDEIAAIGEVVQALESGTATPLEALIRAVAKARGFLAERTAETYAHLRTSVEELERQCQSELAAGETR